MANDWRPSNWGDEVTLEYGKAIRGYSQTQGKFRVFGSNGPIGWTSDALTQGPGVVLGRKGAYRGVEFCREPFWVIDTAYYVVPKTDMDMRWLYYAVKHYKLGEVDDGSPIPSTTRAAVYMLELDVPPKHEQQAISRILGTLDDKIELNRKQNETLEAMARTLFKAWFVDFEPVRAKMEGRWQRGQSLPGLPAHLFDLFPDRLVESELGEIPEGWQTLPVFDLATYVNGAAFKAFQPNDERRGLPIIKIAELKAGVTAQTKFSDAAMPEKYRLRTGDILFSWSGNPDTSIDTFIWAHGDAWLNQHIFRVDIHNPRERAFVIATLKYLRPQFAELARNKQTTGLGHVTVGDMQRLLVVKPDHKILAEWDRVAAPIFAAAFRNEADSNSVARLRDALLPRLISGEVRIADAKRVVGVGAEA